MLLSSATLILTVNMQIKSAQVKFILVSPWTLLQQLTTLSSIPYCAVRRHLYSYSHHLFLKVASSMNVIPFLAACHACVLMLYCIAVIVCYDLSLIHI